MKISISKSDIDLAISRIIDLLRTEHGLPLAEGDVLYDLLVEPLSTYYAYMSSVISQSSALGTIKGIKDLYDQGLIDDSEMSSAVQRVAFDLGIPFADGGFATGEATIHVTDSSRLYEIQETDIIKNQSGQEYAPIGAPMTFGPGVTDIKISVKAVSPGKGYNTSDESSAGGWSLNQTISPYVSSVTVGQMTGGSDPDTVDSIISRIEIGETLPSLITSRGAEALFMKNPDFGSRIRGVRVIGAADPLMSRDLITWNGVPFHRLGMTNVYVDGLLSITQETLSVDSSGHAPLTSKPAFRYTLVKDQGGVDLTRTETSPPGSTEYRIVNTTPSLMNSSREDGYIELDPAMHGGKTISVYYETLMDWDKIVSEASSDDYRPVASDVLIYVPYSMRIGIKADITVFPTSPIASNSIESSLDLWIRENKTIGDTLSVYELNKWFIDTYPSDIVNVTGIEISTEVWGDDGLLYSSSGLSDTGSAALPTGDTQVGASTIKMILDTSISSITVTKQS